MTKRLRSIRGQQSLLPDFGFCYRCGRPLRTAAAVRKGLGETCARRERQAAAGRAKAG